MEYMKAMYTEQTGFPFLDAMPPPMMLRELVRKLNHEPGRPKGIQNMTQLERFTATDRIADVYIPLDYAATIYNSLYAGIRSAYKSTSRISFVGQMNEMGKAIQLRAKAGIPNHPTQAECFSVLGEAGMGKTVTLQKILDMIPQVIQHECYEGYPFPEYQICYLKIECPANNSPRGACMQILEGIDSILDTEFCNTEEKKKSNVDMLITRIAQICVRFHVGCIIIDEVQNILQTRMVAPTPSSAMVKFLVELANKTGTCLVFVGLPTVAPYFDIEPHLARRTRGPRIPYLPYGDAFVKIAEAMWECVPLLDNPPMDAKTKQFIYKITNGSIAKTQKLIRLAAQEAVYFERERITDELLRRVSKQHNIIPTKSMIEVEAPAVLEPKSMRGHDALPTTEGADEIIAHEQTGARIDRPRSRRGRPMRTRDANDLIDTYDECRSKGWSVPQQLINMGLAERMMV